MRTDIVRNETNLSNIILDNLYKHENHYSVLEDEHMKEF